MMRGNRVRSVEQAVIALSCGLEKKEKSNKDFLKRDENCHGISGLL
jgi:hypothetical protein